MRRDIRNDVLDAAERLLGRFGYEKTTMEDLAREAAISKRTLYQYFADKKQVALESIDRVVDRLCERLRLIAAGRDRPEQKLRHMLVERVLYRFDSVQNYYQSFDEMFAALRAEYLARRQRYFAAEAQILRTVIAQGCRTGALLADGDAQTAETLVLATNALLPYSLSPRELGARRHVKQKAVRIATLLVKGLMPHGKLPPRRPNRLATPV